MSEYRDWRREGDVVVYGGSARREGGGVWDVGGFG